MYVNEENLGRSRSIQLAILYATPIIWGQLAATKTRNPGHLRCAVLFSHTNAAVNPSSKFNLSSRAQPIEGSLIAKSHNSPIKGAERVAGEEHTVEAMSDGESDDGRRVSKKRKASRACDRCNSQHQPCDNATPKCSVCERAGTECTYNRPVRKRGPRSGYTGQNGERLWSVVLQARPDIEDLVLQILRGGTYGNTGISNYDYFKNNENQTELVSRFNESRLGRYLQQGESPDLMLPPIDDKSPVIAHQLQPGLTPKSQSSNSAMPVNPPTPAENTGGSLLSSNSPASSVIVNPHGAPQNPGDIYLASVDIRKRPLHNNQEQHHAHVADSPRAVFSNAKPQLSPITQPMAQSVRYNHDYPNGYDGLLRHSTQNETPRNESESSKAPASTSPQALKSGRSISQPPDQELDIGATGAFPWCVLCLPTYVAVCANSIQVRLRAYRYPAKSRVRPWDRDGARFPGSLRKPRTHRTHACGVHRVHPTGRRRGGCLAPSCHAWSFRIINLSIHTYRLVRSCIRLSWEYWG